jgi:acetoin utilization deacetylase AcuC-like enzyme
MTIVFSERFLEHIQTPDHPESPKRLVAVRGSLTSAGLWKKVIEPKDATMEQLASVHDRDYLAFLEHSRERALTMDTLVHRETFGIARLAAGGGILAAERAWEEGKPAIALLRPPGHHARYNYGMGFCYLNNIAIAAKAMLRKAKRLAIVDIDVHHGNGTQDAFYTSPDVLYVSTHQRYIFPGTGDVNDFGEGDGEGFNVNIPMNSPAGDASFEFAHDKIILPILREFEPEMLLVSVGTDSHYMDQLATLTLSSKGHAKEISGLLGFAKERCSGKIAFFLEGGYNLEVLSEIVTHTVGLFEGKDTPLRFNEVADKDCVEKRELQSIMQLQKSYWKLD